ncbi:MAG: polyketide synthase dehydratase domain-containing protein, partial [Polyangiaceae bacterium]
DPSDPRKRHYSAELVLADALPAAPTGPAAALPEAPGIDRIYGETLFHGPLFQVIREVDTVSNRGIAGVLDTTESIGWSGHWRTDPAALDGGLQLALLWAQHCLGGRSLPTGLGSYERFEIQPRGPLQCTLVGQVDGTTRALSTITFRNPDGRVVAELRDVETHQRP